MLPESNSFPSTYFLLGTQQGAANTVALISVSNLLSQGITGQVITAPPFNAKGDGTTDDTAAFQSALNAGGTIWVPWRWPGYLVGNLAFTSNTCLIGLGPSPRLIYRPGVTNWMLNTWSNQNVIIENLEFDGGQNTTFAGQSTLGTRHCLNVVAYSQNARLANLWIHGFNGRAVFIGGGAGLNGCRHTNNISITDVTANFCHTGFESTAIQAEYIWFNTCRAFGCYNAVLTYCGNQQYSGCIFNDNTYAIHTESGANNGKLAVVSCLLNHNTYPVYAAVASYGLTITGCELVGGGTLYLNSSRGVLVRNCLLDLDAILLRSGYYNVIEDNFIGTSYANTITHDSAGNQDQTVIRNNINFTTGATLTTDYLHTTTNLPVRTWMNVITVDASAGNRTVTVSNPTNQFGRTLLVKKLDATANTVAVGYDTSMTIDGATNHVLTAQWQAVELVSNGTNYLIKSKYP